MTIAKIITAGVTDTSLLPSLRSYEAQIADHAQTTYFASVQAARMTYAAGGSYDGLASSIPNRRAGESNAFAEAVTTAKPSVDLDYGPQGKTALRLFSSGTDKLTFSETFDPERSWWKFAVFLPPVTASNGYLLYSGTAGNRHMFHVATGHTVANRVGASGAEALAQAAYVESEWNWAIGGWNHTTKTASISVNGGAAVTATNAAAVVDETAMIMSVGAASEYAVKAWGFGTGDLFQATNADLRTLLNNYARLGLGLAA